MLKASLAVKVAAGAVGVLLAGGGIAFAANSLSNGNDDPGATDPTPGASCLVDEGHDRDGDHEGDGGREGDGHEAPLAVHPNGSGEADDDADSHEADEHDADEPDADDDAQGEDCDDIDDIDESHMSEGPETEESEGPDSDHNSGGGSEGGEATPAPSVSHTGSDD